MKTATRYVCEFCDKEYKTTRGAERHEAVCLRNPDRKLRRGELAAAWMYDLLLEQPAWLPPQPGAIWSGVCWIAVPGYRVEHGNEIWPARGGSWDDLGEPLDFIKPHKARWQAFCEMFPELVREDGRVDEAARAAIDGGNPK